MQFPIAPARTAILALFTLTACNNMRSPRYGETIPANKLDTLQTPAYPVQSNPVIFESAFFKGQQIRQDSESISFYAIDIGEIELETGKIIASDGFINLGIPPFSTQFPKGQFPVQLAIAHFHNGDERNAFSRILFSPNPVARWVEAVHAGQKPHDLYDSTFSAYPVDSGTGLFIDSAARMLFDRLDSIRNFRMMEQISSKMDKFGRGTYRYLLYEFNFHNMAIFSSGWGDGRYGSYIGYDSAGNICRLLTDFYMIDWQKNQLPM